MVHTQAHKTPGEAVRWNCPQGFGAFLHPKRILFHVPNYLPFTWAGEGCLDGMQMLVSNNSNNNNHRNIKQPAGNWCQP